MPRWFDGIGWFVVRFLQSRSLVNRRYCFRGVGYVCLMVMLAILIAGYSATPVVAQNSVNPASRPLLLVNGFCGSPLAFAGLLPALSQQLPANLYPNSTVYYVQYDSGLNVTTFFLEDANGNLVPVDISAIPNDARYFSIQFYDPVGQDTTLTKVSKISVVNKAYEVAQSIKQILSITQQKKVILVGHSMGGLVSRAYIEGLASAGACYDYTTNTTDYSAATCQPGAGGAAFAGDVGDLITVDTPHNGSPLADLSFGLIGLLSQTLACVADPSVNKTELELVPDGGAGLIEALNFKKNAKVGSASAKKNTVPIQAVQSYFSDVLISWDLLLGSSDDIVLKGSQSITSNLPKGRSSAPLADYATAYSSSDAGINATSACFESILGVNFPILHYMECLGPQTKTQNVIIPLVAAHAQSAASEAADGSQ